MNISNMMLEDEENHEHTRREEEGGVVVVSSLPYRYLTDNSSCLTSHRKRKRIQLLISHIGILCSWACDGLMIFLSSMTLPLTW